MVEQTIVNKYFMAKVLCKPTQNVKNITKKKISDQIIHGAPFVFCGTTRIVCEGQIYFNKTSELQPQFHFDEFPPAGVSQAVGGRVERREKKRGDGGWEADRIFMIVIFVIIQKGGEWVGWGGG